MVVSGGERQDVLMFLLKLHASLNDYDLIFIIYYLLFFFGGHFYLFFRERESKLLV